MIIAFDPGVTTGIASHGGTHYTWLFNQFDSSRYTRPKATFYTMLCNLDKPDVIIVEKFLHRNQDNTNYEGLTYQGIIELWAEEKGIPIVWQKLSDCNKFWDDKKIKALLLWKPNNPHSMDALRHLLHYLMQHDEEFRIDTLIELKEAGIGQ